MGTLIRYENPPVDHVLCAIDPGKRACGVSLWAVKYRDDGVKTELTWCGLVEEKSGDPQKLALKIIQLKKTVDFFVYYAEDPQFYPLKRKPHDDLRSLKRVLQSLQREGARPFFRIKPVKWKGNLPKKIHHDRVLRQLSAAESKLVPVDHNVRDAVALGLYALGRTGRGAVQHAVPPRKAHEFE
jgi:hypothetical protein